MICKKCGAEISPRDALCPRCGADIPASEGGVGFWDLLEGPVDPARVTEATTATTETHATQGRPPYDPTEWAPAPAPEPPSKLPLIIGASVGGLCLIGLLVALVLLHNVQTSIDNSTAQLQQDVQTLQTRSDSMEGQLDKLTTALRRQQSGEEGSPQHPLTVSVAPQDTSHEEGFANDEGACLFEFVVDGAVESFVWEKESNGSWTPLKFDESDENATYGLSLKQSIEPDSSTSQLVATGLTKKSGGTYRCIASDEHGNQVACVAKLTLESSSSPSPSSSTRGSSTSTRGGDDAENDTMSSDSASSSDDNTNGLTTPSNAGEKASSNDEGDTTDGISNRPNANDIGVTEEPTAIDENTNGTNPDDTQNNTTTTTGDVDPAPTGPSPRLGN